MGKRIGSLRSQFLFWAAVGITLLGLLAAITMRALQQDQAAEIGRDLTAHSQRIGQMMEVRVDAVRTLLHGLARVPAVRDAAGAECSRLLAEVRTGNPLTQNITAIKPNGDVLCSAISMPAPVNAADRPAFRRALTTRHFAVGDYQISKITGRAHLGLAEPALDERRQVIAVAYAAIDLDWLGDGLQTNFPVGTSLTLLDRSGKVLLRLPDAAGQVGRDLSSHPIFRAAALRDVRLEIEDIDGSMRMFAITPIRLLDQVGAYVAIGVPHNVAFAGTHRLMAMVGMTMLVALALLFGGWWLLKRRVLGPLHDMTEAVRRLRDGQGQPLDISRNDEIGRMAGEFNRMIAAVGEREMAVMLGEVRTGLIFETAPDAMLIVDAQGHIVRANSAAEQLFGLWRTDLMDRALQDMIPAATPEVSRGETALDATPLARQVGRPESWVDVRFAPYHVADDEQIIVALRDITDRRRVEERLVQAEKLEAIGQLTGGLAHDFNNLLGIILGGLDLLEMRISKDEKARKHLELARRAARRGADITRSLLAVARRQRLEPRNIDIRELLEETLPLLRQLAGNEVNVVLVPGDAAAATTPVARIDPGGLSNVILNLVINARDAMPAGGCLDLRYDLVDIDAMAARDISGLAAGRYILIEVRDTGSGISPENLARVFEPFFSTKDRGKGTGLGLATVFGFARQSGGAVTLDSEVGKGTTFRVYLPAISDAPLADNMANGAAAAAGAAADNEALPRGDERILLVDDEVSLLEIAGEWLRGLGYAITTTALPAEALRFLETGEFDMLVSDVVMPGGIDGLALAAFAARPAAAIPVLLVSGHARGIDASEAPPWPLLNKPYNRADLARAVRRLLDARRTASEHSGS